MKIVTSNHVFRDAREATALAGIVAGMLLLLPVYLGHPALAVPALAVLVPSLMYGMR